jgi:hypothetical protein
MGGDGRGGGDQPSGAAAVSQVGRGEGVLGPGRNVGDDFPSDLGMP